MFLHFNITSFPGHFENMVKKSEDTKKKKKRTVSKTRSPQLDTAFLLLFHVRQFAAALLHAITEKICFY